MSISTWRHVFKLDPAKELTDKELERLAESGTDALIVGGSDGITLDNVLDLLVRIRRYAVPVVLEVSTIDSLTPGYDYYFIPTVLNTEHAKWIHGLHHQAIKEHGHLMNWDEILSEGYCILNPTCKAAQLTGVTTIPDDEDVIAYAQMAENFYKLPIFYMEYSGVYGDPQLVREVSYHLEQTKLVYGGGITTAEQAEEMAAYADIVVIGNSIYDRLDEALKTVQAVKKVAR